jgi:hypothetical protein
MTSSSPASSSRLGFKDILLLLLLTAGAVAIHGYHPFVEDAEIYVPGIKQALNPKLYPYNAAFFASHAHLTLFPNLIAASVRISRLPLEWALFGWHFLSIFLLLLACWHVGRLCFADRRARWGGVALVASLLTIPVAGTALYIMDQYVNTRSLSTPAVLFILINVVDRKFVRAALWTVGTALIHPLMVVFGVSYVGLLWWTEWRNTRSSFAYALAGVAFPMGLFPPVTDAYREVMESHSYFFLMQWEWYEWLGILGPLVLLWWFARIAKKQSLAVMAAICNSLVLFGLLFFAIGLLITVPDRFANLAELQPMRSLQLIYVLLFVIGGGLLAQFWLRNKIWRWLLVFVPICAGMMFAQFQLFPSTAHIEWPGVRSSNEWVQAFDWVRENTPNEAYFALDPQHMEASGEDEHGFRAIAERSMLADRIKDSGAVTMFPALAEPWRHQVSAQNGWQQFQKADFERLNGEFGVTWVVLEKPSALSDCPYDNKKLAVCRID